jgi:CubicO group peptidase (beta-lactamase class C family)
VLEGTIDPEFQAVADLFDHHLTRGGGGGVAVYHRGRRVLDAYGGIADVERGTPWHAGTIAMAFSTSKGIVSTALHMCVDRGLLDYDDRVAQHWPEFAQHGKEDITVRQALCHEAGLYDIESMLSYPEQLLEWDEMVAAIERARPAYEPGTANAYHAVTFGYLVGELITRVSGREISEFIGTEIAGPLGLDGAFVGTPDDQLDRVAPLIYPEDIADILRREGETGSESGSGVLELAEAMGLEVHPEVTRAAFGATRLRSLAGTPEALRHPIPSFNGTFNAGSLARVYAALAAGGSLGGVTLLSTETLARATEIQNQRPDLAIVFPMHWRLGYHGVLTTAGVPPRAFGHSGLGGSGAWADPDRELAVAMVVNRLSANLVGDDRLMAVGGAAIECADATDEV